jgi:amino acid adenylation domain-containing protein/thioester reductase-like protein
MSASDVHKNTAVSVFGENTIDLLCAVVAIWQFGAYYVAINTSNPFERNMGMKRDCRSTVALVVGHAALTLARQLQYDIIIDVQALDVDTTKSNSVQSDGGAESIAAIYYTSGSTGTPKGVISTHGNLLAQATAVKHRISLTSPIILQQSHIAFDAWLFELLVAFTTGGTLLMTSSRHDPEEIVHLIETQRVNVTFAVPSEYLMWFRYGSNVLPKTDWCLAFCGGEAMTESLVQGFANLGLENLELINGYGPTEVSVCCSMTSIPYRSDGLSFPVSIGRPLANYDVFIVDKNGLPLPPGWVGEICVVGPGVSPGYVKDCLNFLNGNMNGHAPAVKRSTYRTGDRGRMDNDGAITFLGRIGRDQVIKLRGMQIDLLDVTNTILSMSKGLVSECIVLLIDDRDPYLAAFCVLQKDSSPTDTNGVMDKLIDTFPLPTYMRPAIVVELAAMPLLVSGKVDLVSLHEIARHRTAVPMESRKIFTPTEEMVARIWELVLAPIPRSKSLCPTTDFFSAGGTSILLLGVLEKLRLRKPSLRLRHLLHDPTIAGMAAATMEDAVAIEATRPAVAVANWEEETTLPSFVIPLEMSNEAAPCRDSLIVLLTGATGFLGSSILDSLMKAPEVTSIHCVAVRSPEKLRKYTQRGKRVVVHEGQLCDTSLGLRDEDFTSLSNTVDVIIHNGATVSFLQPYTSLRAANVCSTKELIRLASQRRIPFHFISTAGLAQLESRTPFSEVSVSGHYPSNEAGGYLASKWVSEVLLERAQSRYRIPVIIYRPTSTVEPRDWRPAPHGGAASVPKNDALQNVFKYSLEMGAAPTLTNLSGSFDLVPVEVAARTIVRDVLEPPPDGVKYIHISGAVKIPVSKLADYLSDICGSGVAGVALKDWIQKGRELGMNDELAEWLVGLDDEISALPEILRKRELAV